MHLADFADLDSAGRWAGREAARTPARFRDRVLGVFRSGDNLAYLRRLFGCRVPWGPLRDHALATLHDAVLGFSEGEGRALDILRDDPLAQRGAARPAVSLWDEVRRLNRAFYEDRLAFLRENAATIERRAPRDGLGEDDEPYHMRMFVADSLRPPGLEHLNTPGPLYALREDQSTWLPAKDRPRARAHESFGHHGPPESDADVYPWGEDDAPWGAGDANRTPEQAVAEYWGDGWTTSETQIGHPEIMGRAYGSTYGWGAAAPPKPSSCVTNWGDTWEENGGTRFMRYQSPPFWQKGGREGIDYDIEETLGTQARELDGHVRRWGMEKVTHPRGQEYRRYGPRTGHVV
jgi:hypothetical protein